MIIKNSAKIKFDIGKFENDELNNDKSLNEIMTK